ncbi:MAG: ribulokinase [Clostridia bacterium]|nr:ribulokinase [Clostridia bacterium]
MAKYTIGIDFGTLSVRALVSDVETGREMGWAVCDYPHGVMDASLPDGTILQSDWALQHPEDYIYELKKAVKEAVRKSGADKESIIAVGVDFTASTVIPVDQSMRPLSDKYPSNPHAYVKLWKHHAAQTQADRMTRIAEEQNYDLLDFYGGRVSSEWTLPKIVQMLEEDERLFDETDLFVEAGDWIVYCLTGKYRKSAMIAGYKAFYSTDRGYPEKSYLKAIHPKLENIFETKLRGEVYPAGQSAGTLTREMAQALSLPEGIDVAIAAIDAHVSLPAADITRNGEMLMIMGTSSCHIVLGGDMKKVNGMCGAVKDQVIPNLTCFEAGQSCVGDMFDWFVRNNFPAEYEEKAKKLNMNRHEYLTHLSKDKKPGESGLIALDWLNGNRSVLVNAELSGLILGMTLSTKAEDIYRALIESAAFGTRMIVDTFDKAGVPIEKICACGGISTKNEFLMQIYADVLKRDIRIARSAQACALGSCIYAASAAGSPKGGYDDVFEAARHMGGVSEKVYRPRLENTGVYDRLYAEYRRLHDFFGRGGNDVMKRLRSIKKDASR